MPYLLRNYWPFGQHPSALNSCKIHFGNLLIPLLVQESGGLAESILRRSLASQPNPINRRRSERVMLQMKITVIAEDVRRTPRQEEALTLVVNAHGGLLKMKLGVHIGQPMRLVNPKNGVEQNCRVIRVDDTSSDFFSVAFEFDHPNAKFWPVVFPPADWVAPRG